MKTHTSFKPATRFMPRRLLRLAAALDRLSPKRFNFSRVVEHGTPCGTVGCAIGWTPAVFPTLVVWQTDHENNYGSSGVSPIDQPDVYCNFADVAVWLFGLSLYIAHGLFAPNTQYKIKQANLPCAATAKEVASMLRQFVRDVKAGRIDPQATTIC